MFHVSSVFKNIIDNRYFLKCYNVIFFKLLKKKKKPSKQNPDVFVTTGIRLIISLRLNLTCWKREEWASDFDKGQIVMVSDDSKSNPGKSSGSEEGVAWHCNALRMPFTHWHTGIGSVRRLLSSFNNIECHHAA